MIWATVSSGSCFYWLYRVSPSLATKNIISMILVLIIWWYLCIDLSLVLLGKGVCYDQYVLLAELCWPLPCFILYSKFKLACFPGISWLPAFAFQLPIMKRTSLFGVSSRKYCRSSASLALVVGTQTCITVMLNGLPQKWTEIILSFLRLHPSTAFWTLVDYEGCSISSKGFLSTVVDIMVIWIKFTHSSSF